MEPQGRTKPRPVPGGVAPSPAQEDGPPQRPARGLAGQRPSLLPGSGLAVGGWLGPRRPGQRVEARLLSTGTCTGSWGSAGVRTPLLSAQKERGLRPGPSLAQQPLPLQVGPPLPRQHPPPPTAAACIQEGAEERGRASRTREGLGSPPRAASVADATSTLPAPTPREHPGRGDPEQVPTSAPPGPIPTSPPPALESGASRREGASNKGTPPRTHRLNCRV